MYSTIIKATNRATLMGKKLDDDREVEMMTAKEWLKETFRREPVGCLVRPRAICKDGFSISIQASAYHYCTPKRGLKDGKYTQLELGFPSEYEELLDKYRGGAIYLYVPIEVVEEVIEKHGGIVGC